jgi:hypothetical protein
VRRHGWSKLPGTRSTLKAATCRISNSFSMTEIRRKLVLFGEGSLRRALAEYIAHFQKEQNHQGKTNLLLFPSPEIPLAKSRVVRRIKRLGGLLNFYSRAAWIF